MSKFNWLSLALGLTVMGLVGCDTSTSIEPPAPPPPEPSVYNMTPRKAEVGVGKKGAKLRADDSIGKKLSGGATVQVLFDTKEKAVFEIQLPQAMQLYKAQDSFGKGPQSHDEYMEKIVRFNQIPLPELPEGMHYKYRPDIEELWVYPDVPVPGQVAEPSGTLDPGAPPAEPTPNP